jgi:hexosaminidase
VLRLLLATSSSFFATAVPPPSLVPLPAKVAPQPGPPFVLAPASRIVVSGGRPAAQVGGDLAHLLRPSTGFALPVTAAAAGGPHDVRLVLSPRSRLPAEGYIVVAGTSGLTVTARTPAGLFDGVQTVRELLPQWVDSPGPVRSRWAIRPIRISDAPRFAWRGVELDVARHFFTVPEVERLIDLFASYKLNVLHLHLTDDQGWRFPVPGWPLLESVGGQTQVGATPAGSYSVAQYRAIVAYAASRFMTVVPEVDMPSHVGAALASYPSLACDGQPPMSPWTSPISLHRSLCAGSPDVTRFVHDVVAELVQLTPGPYIDLGGDEAASLSWPKYWSFVQAAETLVTAAHKTLIGWAPGIDAVDLPPNTLLQWYSDVPGAGDGVIGADVAAGKKVVMSPGNHTYLNFPYVPTPGIGATLSVRDSYVWDPARILTGVREGDILGIESALWTEWIRSLTDAEQMLLPRLPGLAELAWSTRRSTWAQYRVRLAAQAGRWQAAGLSFYPAPDVPWPK